MLFVLTNNIDFLLDSQGGFGIHGFTPESVILSAKNILYSYLFIQIGFFLSFKEKEKIEFRNNYYVIRYAKLFFIFGLIAYLYKLGINIKGVLNYGYLYLFNPSINQSSDNLILKILVISFHVGFSLLLGSLKGNPNFRIYRNIYIIVLILNLFTGQRGETFKFILSYLIIGFSHYRKKVKFKNLIFLITLFIFSLVFIDIYRSKTNFIGLYQVFEIIFGQSKSFMILNYSIQYENILNYDFINLFSEIRSWSYSIFSRFTGVVNPITQDQYLSMKEFGHLGQKLSYITNQGNFNLGKGLGTSFIAEIFLVFGLAGQIFAGLFLGFFIAILSRRSYSSLSISFKYFIISSLLFLPRDSFLNFVSDNIITFPLILLIYYGSNLRLLPKKL